MIPRDAITNSCFATAADGASVNFGKNSGVLTRLLSSLQWLIKTHCVAHYLEIVLTDALKVLYYNKTDQLMITCTDALERNGKDCKMSGKHWMSMF